MAKKQKAQKGKVITGDLQYDKLLNKRDSVIQASSEGHKNWDYFLKKGVEQIKLDKAKKLQNLINNEGVIEDNMGQLKHPGKVTKINSNKITMKGVNYPVLGVSDVGHQQLMLPNQEYDFKGNVVTEFPILKRGGKLKKGQQGMGMSPIDLNWGSEEIFTPGQFSTEGQLNQFNNTLPQQPGFLGKVGEQLGGPMGILNTATSLIGGIQQIGQNKEAKRQAKQAYRLSKVVKQAAMLEPDQVKRKYHRPEDQVFDPNEMFPTYGVGTNYLADQGASIEYVPLEKTDVKQFQEGGLIPQIGTFFEGIGSGRAGNLGSMLGSAIGGGRGVPNGASQVGSTLGGVAGSFLGPVGGAVGSFLGGAIGGVIGGKNQRETNRYNRNANNNLTAAAFAQGSSAMRNQYRSFMEDGGELRTGGNLRKNYAMGGDIETYWGGGVAPISENPYLPEDGQTVMFKGASHEDGGIGMKFGGKSVEVEGGEPAVKLNDEKGNPNLTIFGNMKIPAFGVMELNDPNAKNRKFKNYINDLSKTEDKQNKIVNKNLLMIDALDVATPFDKLKLSSGKAMVEGANMRLKDIAKKKQTASMVQNAILETADEFGLESDALSQGKIKKAKFGYKMAQDGKRISRTEIDEYLKQGYQPDPQNPNRLFKKTSTPGKTETITVKEPGKGGEEFNRAFGAARKAGKQDFMFGNKKYTTDLFKNRTKTITSPGTEAVDYIDIYDPETNNITPQTPKTPGMSYTPSQGKGQKSGLNWMDVVNTALPYLRPSNQLDLDPNQLAGERYALATNQLDPVQAQLYHPLLEQVSDISLQDQLNANQADFNSIQRIVGNNPAALASLASQKYQANTGVLGEQFRHNQAKKEGVYNRNRGTLNDAQLKNLSILDQQYVRQATAKSRTKETALAALNSISDKIQRNKLENKTLGVYENLYNYRFGPKGYAYNLNPLAEFEFPSAGDTNNAYLDSLVPQGKEPEFNSRGQLKDVGSKSKKNGGIVKAMKYC